MTQIEQSQTQAFIHSIAQQTTSFPAVETERKGYTSPIFTGDTSEGFPFYPPLKVGKKRVQPLLVLCLRLSSLGKPQSKNSSTEKELLLKYIFIIIFLPGHTTVHFKTFITQVIFSLVLSSEVCWFFYLTFLSSNILQLVKEGLIHSIPSLPKKTSQPLN